MRATLPGWIIGLVDPAQKYLEDVRSEQCAAPVAIDDRSLLEPVGTLRRATAQESEAMRPRLDEEAARYEAAFAAARDQWWTPALSCAEELLRPGSGEQHLTGDGWELRSRIVRFRRGDAVLEISKIRNDHHPSGTLRARIDRRAERRGAEVVARYLIRSIADDGQ